MRFFAAEAILRLALGLVLGIAVVVLREMGDVEVERFPSRSRPRRVPVPVVHGGKSILDQLGGRAAAGRLVPVQRHADENVVRPQQPAHGGEGVHRVGEIVANPAQAVVELGRTRRSRPSLMIRARSVACSNSRTACSIRLVAMPLVGKCTSSRSGAGIGEGLQSHLDEVRAGRWVRPR